MSHAFLELLILFVNLINIAKIMITLNNTLESVKCHSHVESAQQDSC